MESLDRIGCVCGGVLVPSTEVLHCWEILLLVLTYFNPFKKIISSELRGSFLSRKISWHKWLAFP